MKIGGRGRESHGGSKWGSAQTGWLEIEWASDAEARFVQDMGIDLGGADILVSEEFLDGADVLMIFEEMGGEAVPERMRGGGLGDPRGMESGLHRALDHVVSLMMPPDDARARVGGESVCWKDPEPRPLLSGIGVFEFQGVGKIDAGNGLGAIPIKQGASLCELPSQWLDQVFRKKGMAIFPALSIADEDGATFKVEILDTQGQHFREAHAGAVEKTRHEERKSLQVQEQAADFLPGEDDGESARAFGRLELRQLSDGNVQNVLIEEDDGVERLILGGGSHIPLHGEVIEEGRDGLGPQLGGVNLSVEEDVATDPSGVGLLGAVGPTAPADGGANLIEEPWLGRGSEIAHTGPLSCS